MVGTWKRQMKFYGVAIVLGVILMSVAFSQMAGHPHPGAHWFLLMVVGGLGFLGGLFGLALAVFFHIWHRR